MSLLIFLCMPWQFTKAVISVIRLERCLRIQPRISKVVTIWNNVQVLRMHVYKIACAGLGGSVGCAVRLETRRSRVQPPPRSATFFRGD